MIDRTPQSTLTPNLIVRAVVGFFAGLLVGVIAFLFFGLLHGHHDLNRPELEREHRNEWLVFWIACAAAILAMSAGRCRLSRFWMWFIIVFGVTCAIPYWPFKDGSLLPFGMPYINGGFAWDKVLLLTIHSSLAGLIASGIHRFRPEANDIDESGFPKELPQHPSD